MKWYITMQLVESPRELGGDHFVLDVKSSTEISARTAAKRRAFSSKAAALAALEVLNRTEIDGHGHHHRVMSDSDIELAISNQNNL